MRYHGRLADLAKDALEHLEKGAIVMFVMPSLGVAERVVEILDDYEVQARLALVEDTSDSSSAAAIVTVGRLTGGFELPSARIIVHVESDLFDEAAETALERRGEAPVGRRQTSAGGRKKSKTAAFLSDFRDLKVGDFVVHVDHGIGRFGGLQILDLGPRRSEFMLLFYADEAKLYVPVERLDLVQRYSSAEGHQPTLDSLGGIGWQKTKAKSQARVARAADELLRLTRAGGGRRLRVSADSPWLSSKRIDV
jgi:transcription-repair coupling factor (superfamily II helicase)